MVSDNSHVHYSLKHILQLVKKNRYLHMFEYVNCSNRVMLHLREKYFKIIRRISAV